MTIIVLYACDGDSTMVVLVDPVNNKAANGCVFIIILLLVYVYT